MRNLRILFLFIALLAGALGFGVFAGAAATIAKVSCGFFAFLFAGSLLYNPARWQSEV